MPAIVGVDIGEPDYIKYEFIVPCNYRDSQTQKTICINIFIPINISNTLIT